MSAPPIDHEAEEQLTQLVMRSKFDPLFFVNKFFPWGEPGTDLKDFPEGPDKWHRELFAKLTEHTSENYYRKQRGEPMMPFRAAVKSGHGIGKSACVAWLILWLMSTRPMARGVVTANTEDQLKKKTWVELGKWHDMALNKHWFRKTAGSLHAADEDKWRIDATPWSETNTEGFAGLHNTGSATIIIFDEASGIPAVIWEVANGALTDANNEIFWFAFGNPTRNDGEFFECFNRFRHRWNPVTVDSREVRISNNEQIQEWIEDHGEDSDWVRVRVLGQFPNMGDSQFIPMDLVDNAISRNLEDDPNAGLVIGVDIARFGDDETVVCIREGRRVIKMLSWRDRDLMYTAGRVAELINQYNPDSCFVDDVGMGGGVTDRLRQLGYRPIAVNAGEGADDKENWADRRTEMWARMREWLSGADMPDIDKLRTDLISPQYGFNAKSATKLERKEDMKKRGLSSPDYGDALALTFAHNTPTSATKLGTRHMGRGRMRFADGDYDPYDT